MLRYDDRRTAPTPIGVFPIWPCSFSCIWWGKRRYIVCGLVGLRQSLGRRMHIMCVVFVEKHFIGKSSGFVTADRCEPRHGWSIKNWFDIWL